MEIVNRLLKGDKISLARAISRVENGEGAPILEALFPYSGQAYHIGITGPPGAGKSTLVDKLTAKFVEEGKRVGIIAVDPTSPFSGGALLGDRVRMSALTGKEGVFIRSMASRGSLGGIARATKDVALVLDAYGMDYIIIETVGVGQVELDIAQLCDTTIVVLVPESGDSIQAMKAGLLEIADIIVVNKADREGADRMVTELKFTYELRSEKGKWKYPILQTVATRGEGIELLGITIGSHRDYAEGSGSLKDKRKERIRVRITELIEEKIRERLRRQVFKKGELEEAIERIYRKELNPFRIADEIVRQVIN